MNSILCLHGFFRYVRDINSVLKSHINSVNQNQDKQKKRSNNL